MKWFLILEVWFHLSLLNPRKLNFRNILLHKIVVKVTLIKAISQLRHSLTFELQFSLHSWLKYFSYCSVWGIPLLTLHRFGSQTATDFQKGKTNGKVCWIGAMRCCPWSIYIYFREWTFTCRRKERSFSIHLTSACMVWKVIVRTFMWCGCV